MKPLLRLTLAALVSSVPVSALAWGHTGHMTVAQIAYLRLTDTTRQKVDALIQIQLEPTSKRGPHGSTIEIAGRTDIFVTAACWADDIKSNANREWHFRDTAFSPDGTVPDVTIPDKNVVSVIQSMLAELKDPATSEHDRAQALRFLIHLVGDIHQPLHCSTRCTHEHEKGDRGGNDFMLVGAKDLHAYWDDGVKLFADVQRPLTAAGAVKIRSYADQFAAAFPIEGMQTKLTDTNVEHWADDSSDLAESVAYNLPENSAPSSSYNSKGQKVVKKQVALAGYRLASLLNSTFDPGAVP